MAGTTGQSHSAWTSPASPSSFSPNLLHSRPLSDSPRDMQKIGQIGGSGARAERSHSLASPLASPLTPSSAGGMPSASRMSSRESQQDYWSRRHSNKMEEQTDARSVSLAVPYANTAPSTRPTLGNRPLQAGTMVNGVLKHNRTSTPMIETQSQRSGKRTLNLLNPVNLLMRRRSQIPQTPASDDSNTKSLKVPPMTLPDDYDPRIRGSVVHDFSAPRPRRGSSHQNVRSSTYQGQSPLPELDLGTSISAETSAFRPHSSGNANTKRASEQSAFKEQFDDGRSDQHRSSAIQAEALANQDFLKRFSQQSQTYDPSALPAFSRNSQQLDFQQFRRSIGEWQTRLSDPSSEASKSEISSLSNIPSDHRASHFSQVSPESEAKDRSSQALSNPDSMRLSQTSAGINSHRSSQIPVSSQDLDKVAENESIGQPRSSHSKAPSQDMDKRSEDGLPKHVKSNASRFSFQLGGNDSALEERLLEERAKDQRSSDAKQDQHEEDEEDSFDENAMYDYDELEERDDESSLLAPMGQQDMSAFASALPVGNGYPMAYGPLPVITTPGGDFTMQPNSNIQQYLDYQRAQAAQAGQLPQTSQAGNMGASVADVPAQVDQTIADDAEAENELCDKRSDSHQGLPQDFLYAPQKVANEYRRSRASHDFDDDLYFNDGSVDPLADEEDSSYLDDGQVDEDVLFGSDYEDELNAKHGHRTKPNLKISTADDVLSHRMPEEDPNRLGPNSSPPTKGTSSPKAVGLAAYHSALADAAHKAAADGQFSRSGSAATTTSKYSQRSRSSRLSTRSKQDNISRQPSSNGTKHHPRDSYSGFDFGFNDPTTASSGNTPQSATFPINAITTESTAPTDATSPFSPSPYTTNFDDDCLSDDAIISEANADALASDEEGFYGREFGFYARPRAGSDVSEAEPVIGGYFGAPGGNTIERKYSVKEPNLTPITERSEFSTRNSFVSGFGGPAFSPAVASPAFAAQLARLSPLALAQLQEDDEVERVLRARGWTEGTGRSGSVSSMSSAGQVPWANGRGSWTVAGTGGQFAFPPGQHRGSGGSGLGMGTLWGQEVDSNRSSVRMSRSQSEMYDRESASDSPVSTQSARGLGWGMGNGNGTPDMDVTPRKGEGPQSSPQTAVKERPKQTGPGHIRKGSGGADSVTYVKEKDEGGNDRWVLERKRTSEGGLVELVGREILEGGRI
ncbi:Hypothetical protein D9617_3g019090 [Elsinoe fawcettii]|nr:Hypothetical protein D9617_3g019090 [Elsinoe fawcettii]